MNLLLIVLVIAILAALVLLVARRQRVGVTEPTFPYTAAHLFSNAERSFLGVLEQAVDGQYQVFAKVRLADLLKVRPGLDRSASQSAFNKISAKHADFVLCHPSDLRTVAVIELDDASHRAASRKARDSFFDGAFTAAEIPVYHFDARTSYSLHDLRRELSIILAQGAPRSEADGSWNRPEQPARATPVASNPRAIHADVEPPSPEPHADEEFEHAMDGLYDRVVAACPGYKPTGFLRAVRAHGGLGTAQRFLASGPSVQSGLERLADAGALHVSMECLVLQFPHLFTPDEMRIASERLHTVVTARPHLYTDTESACVPVRRPGESHQSERE
ncbi:MAG: DUF2726 domain-containing protein [Trueperaceae bacterium]|nr:DUF2726 domain-containing protein [Trueperaceae bacterium]